MVAQDKEEKDRSLERSLVEQNQGEYVIFYKCVWNDKLKLFRYICIYIVYITGLLLNLPEFMTRMVKLASRPFRMFYFMLPYNLHLKCLVNTSNNENLLLHNCFSWWHTKSTSTRILAIINVRNLRFFSIG